MKNLKVINGALINKLYTKCFFVDRKLCYQIVINYENDLVLFKNFKTYSDYRTLHNHCIDAINKGQVISTDFQIMDAQPTNSSLRSA